MTKERLYLRQATESVDSVLEEAKDLVPELLVLLESRTERAPLVAIAALEMAAGAIMRATDHALDYSYDEASEFRRDAIVVKALAGLPPRPPCSECGGLGIIQKNEHDSFQCPKCKGDG